MESWRDKVVLVTGGTAGFGMVFAQVAARAGAQVFVSGRDPARLAEAVAELRAINPAANGVEADVTRDDQVERLFRTLQQQAGRLDMLVNNVGRSTRGLAADTTVAQYQELWEANFLSAVRCTRAALPLLAASRGHLVFMGSLASKSAARFLGAYPPSKFAVAAYAQQLRLELAGQGVHVLLVCPGPIARAEERPRYGDPSGKLPESALRPGGGVQLTGIAPEKLAERILRACVRRQPELVIPWKARLLFALAQLCPSLGDWILQRKT